MTTDNFTDQLNQEIDSILSPYIRTVIKTGSINKSRLKKFGIQIANKAVPSNNAEISNLQFAIFHNGEAISPVITLDVEEFMSRQIETLNKILRPNIN